jgi:ADP-heptose:LPS heptosyltransferase
MHSAQKILASQFKNVGDAVLMTPVLRGFCEVMPECELPTLAPGEIAHILEHLPSGVFSITLQTNPPYSIIQ